jgi:hypothetical protein
MALLTATRFAPIMAARFGERAREAREQAAVIRGVLIEHTPEAPTRTV